jgi:pyridoxal phosphate enzyme (YggS family)
MSVQQNLHDIRKNIPSGCTLIAVSKTQPPEKILEAYQAGQRVFGENRAQELASKAKELPADIEWHMIGHLQTNKVKYIAPVVSLIHSVDSPKLLEEIDRQAQKVKRVIPCLLQVHIAEEDTKFGFSPEEIVSFIDSNDWIKLANIEVRGLMGMATFTDDEAQLRREFRTLKSLYDRLKARSLPDRVSMRELSMGMSGDYKLAIEEGSTMVRIGTAIFGERLAKH